MHKDCVVCLEYLFDSVKPMKTLKCGHVLHEEVRARGVSSHTTTLRRSMSHVFQLSQNG
jgi:hypothetical protein